VGICLGEVLSPSTWQACYAGAQSACFSSVPYGILMLQCSCIAAICSLDCIVLPSLKLAGFLCCTDYQPWLPYLITILPVFVGVCPWQPSLLQRVLLVCFCCVAICNRGASWSMFWWHCCHHCRVLQVCLTGCSLYYHWPLGWSVGMLFGWL
jgi:hypothetical protein